MNDESMVSAGLDENTVDLQLTPEQMLELSLAAEPAAVGDSPPSRFRWHQTPIAKMAAATVAVAALAWWCGSQLAGHAAPAVAAGLPTVIPRPVLIAEKVALDEGRGGQREVSHLLLALAGEA